MSTVETRINRGAGVDWLGRATAAAGVVSLLSYAFGWLYIRAYCNAIGAPWHLTDIPAHRIIAEGYMTLFVLSIGAAAAWVHMESGHSSRSADYISIGWGALGAILLGVSYSSPAGSTARMLTGHLAQFVLTFSVGTGPSAK